MRQSEGEFQVLGKSCMSPTGAKGTTGNTVRSSKMRGNNINKMIIATPLSSQSEETLSSSKQIGPIFEEVLLGTDLPLSFLIDQFFEVFWDSYHFFDPMKIRYRQEFAELVLIKKEYLRRCTFLSTESNCLQDKTKSKRQKGQKRMIQWQLCFESINNSGALIMEVKCPRSRVFLLRVQVFISMFGYIRMAWLVQYCRLRFDQHTRVNNYDNRLISGRKPLNQHLKFYFQPEYSDCIYQSNYLQSHLFTGVLVTQDRVIRTMRFKDSGELRGVYQLSCLNLITLICAASSIGLDFDIGQYIPVFWLSSSIILFPNMDDFLSDITEEMIEVRLKKMRDFLRQEHEDILKKIRDQSEFVFTSKRGKGSGNTYDEVQKSYALFTKACENILNTYFPLLCEDEFLALQTQQEVMEKMSNLKALIERNAGNLVRRLNRPKEEVQKDKRIKKEHRRRGKNSKIPLESTSIMQKWLLENFNDPYPTQVKKQEMARESKLTVYQVNNWFINARERVIKRFLKKDLKENQRSMSKSQEEYDSS